MLINQLGSGCTSGHFLCGVSRLSPRSLVATATFFTTALITASTYPAPIPKISLRDGLPQTVLHLASRKGYELSIPSSRTALTLLATLVAINRLQLVLSSYLLTTYPTNARPPPGWIKEVPYFLSGLIFALGLQISGMLSPLKVISFLQPFSPSFDPSLAMVVIAGVLPNALHYVDLKKEAKLFWEEWRVPERRDIDWKLITGSVWSRMGIGGCMSWTCARWAESWSVERECREGCRVVRGYDSRYGCRQAVLMYIKYLILSHFGLDTR
jgi:hypothetical protein